MHKNVLVKQIPFQERAWEISFNIKPLHLITTWASILHFTTGGDNGVVGFRIPGIWFHPGTLKLVICSAINSNPNHCFTSSPISQGKFTKITIRQTHHKDYTYLYKIFIHNKEVFSVYNHHARVFSRVQVFSGDPWYNPADALVRDLTFKNLPTGGKNVLFDSFSNSIH